MKDTLIRRELMINPPCMEGRLTAIDGTAPPIAVKVWSDVLQAAGWVVADDLPKGEWPMDASVYTHTKVKILKDVGQEPLAWVHAIKQMFGAAVVSGGRRSAPVKGHA